MLVLIFTMGMPQNAFAQNKWKKLKYLGHQYEGWVNKKKIPEGEGSINFGSKKSPRFVEGTFDGNKITNAIVDYPYDIVYYGDVDYDESNTFTLHAGGVVSLKVYVEDGEARQLYTTIQDTLKEDILSSFLLDKYPFVTVDAEIEPIGGDIWVLEPPKKFRQTLTVPRVSVVLHPQPQVNNFLEGFYVSRQKVSSDKYEIRPYGVEKQAIMVKGFKDNKGREWNYERSGDFEKAEVGSNLYPTAYTYMVTYPDSSFFSCKYKKDAEPPYVFQYRIVYSDGNYIDGYRKYGYEVQNVIEVAPGIFMDGGSYSSHYDFIDQFIKRKDEQKPFLFGSLSSKDDLHKVLLSNPNIISEDIDSLINKYVINNSHLKISHGYERFEVVGSDGKTVGIFKDGHYVSNAELEKQKEIEREKALAEQEKMDAEKKAENERLFASIKRRFGFDPTVKKWIDIIKVGRSASLIDDYVNYYNDNIADGFIRGYVGYSLEIDGGNERCYKIWGANSRYWTGIQYRYNGLRTWGYMWVRGDKITVVSWD